MQWTKEFRNRRHLNVWQIPVAIRRAAGLQDGDECLVGVNLDRFVSRILVVLTSGGEFRIPIEQARRLQAVASKSKSSVVDFELVQIGLLGTHEEEFQRQVSKAEKLKASDRRKLAKKMPRFPKVSAVTTWAYARNPYVVADVLDRPRGRCEECGEPAPFNRAADGSPYLEVHHTKRLADGGEDTVKNAAALCPNCHREAHYG